MSDNEDYEACMGASAARGGASATDADTHGHGNDQDGSKLAGSSGGRTSD